MLLAGACVKCGVRALERAGWCRCRLSLPGAAAGCCLRVLPGRCRQNGASVLEQACWCRKGRCRVPLQCAAAPLQGAVGMLLEGAVRFGSGHAGAAAWCRCRGSYRVPRRVYALEARAGRAAAGCCLRMLLSERCARLERVLLSEQSMCFGAGALLLLPPAARCCCQNVVCALELGSPLSFAI